MTTPQLERIAHELQQVEELGNLPAVTDLPNTPPRAELLRAREAAAEAVFGGIDRPNVDRPNVDRPNVDRPNVDRPNVDRPNDDRPYIDAPNVDAPNVDAPNVNR